MSVLNSTFRLVSSAGGQFLRAATGVLAVRPSAKPLHPRGSVVLGTLRRFGATGSGSEWLDDQGEDRVVVRQSRAVGLPTGAPDVFGLALRVPNGEGEGDLLFATTGLGWVSRYLLTVARTPYGRPMTTLLPYETPNGPVILSAVFRGEREVALSWAHGSGTWHPFAELSLDQEPVDEPDASVSFDPVRHALPGLATYDWVRRLREPSYATARRSRGR